MSDESNHPLPAYHTHAETLPSSEATIPSVCTPQHTSIDLTEAQSSPPEASKDLPPSRPPQHDQFTIIDGEEPWKRDEEAANTSITPKPSRSWKSKEKYALCLMLALSTAVAVIFIPEFARTAHYANPMEEGPRVSHIVSGSGETITQTTTRLD